MKFSKSAFLLFSSRTKLYSWSISNCNTNAHRNHCVCNCVRSFHRLSADVLPLQAQSKQKRYSSERLRNGFSAAVNSSTTKSSTTAILSDKWLGKQSTRAFNGFGNDARRSETGGVCYTKWIRLSSTTLSHKSTNSE